MAPKSVYATVKYAKPGTRPPVYLAGSFSNPAWQAAKMEYTSGEDNEYEFHKEVRIEEGKEYQYKFRIGEGDWWVLNEDSPSGTDNAGNRNNLLVIPVSTETIIYQPSDSITEEKSSAPPAEMGNFDTKSIEEKMGTREPSDVLFDDEIVRDSDETSITPLALVQLPKLETSNKEESKPAKLKGDFVRLLDGAGQGPLAETEQTHMPTGQQQKPKDPMETEDSQTKFADSTLDGPAGKKDSSSIDVTRESGLSSEPGLKEEVTKTHAMIVPEAKDDVAATGGNSNDRASAKGESPAPDLTIKEIDAQDNDSVGATLSEKDHGSEPGYIMVEDRALTPELASTAAEVADSAAQLDPREPTPPISDEEAGQIGYRRMSSTPIPQVAATAAEVADVAALLDQEDSLEAARAAFEASLTPEEREYVASGRSTPEHEKVPLFPHEMPMPVDDIEPTRSAKEEIPEIVVASPYITQEFDPDRLEPFPTDREEIMEHLRRMQERLPEDQVQVDIAPAPSAVIFHRSDYNGGRRQSEADPVQPSTPKELSEDPSPALEMEQKGGDQNEGRDKLPTLSDIKEEISTLEHEIQSSPAIIIENLKSGADATNDTDHSDKEAKIKEPMVLTGLTPQPLDLPNTPFVTSDRQLSSEDGETVEPKTNTGSPKINFIPPTPAGSSIHTTDPLESVDAGNSTAFEDNSGLIRARKQNPSPGPDRPLTPSSMRSAGKDAHERNFLKAFWRVVFVDWIGGLILRLCGGNRRQTALLIVGVAVLAAAAYLR